MPMLTMRTYVVTSPSLAAAVQRAHSTLDFDPLVVEIIPRVCRTSAQTKKIREDAKAKEEGRVPMVKRSHEHINPGLAPHRIDDLTKQQLNHFSNFLENIEDNIDVDLFRFITRPLMAASMHAFYGPRNPFAVRPELVEKYWDWDHMNLELGAGVLPQLTTRKAYQGLEAIVKGFIEYTNNGYHKEANPLMQEKKRMHNSEGISDDENARLELAISFAIDSNAGITCFWVLNNLFSRPHLLGQIRNEIYQNAFEAPGTISVNKLRDTCPLLNSVFRESVRLITPMVSARYITEDTILEDSYLLRKGSLVQIANGVIHADTNIWGDDASLFNPHRFLYSPRGSKSNHDGSISNEKANIVHAAAFRGFGGGTNMCPGRHFAQMEVLGATAALALGFDIQPISGKSQLQWDPPRNENKFSLALLKPSRAVNVRFSRRAEFKMVKWVLKA